MITTLIACLISSCITLAVCWLFLIPKQINEVRDSARNLLVIYHNDEIQPIQDILKSYPDIIEEIHDDIDKLEFAVDLLSSEGQSTNSEVEENKLLKEIYSATERINSPK